MSQFHENWLYHTGDFHYVVGWEFCYGDFEFLGVGNSIREVSCRAQVKFSKICAEDPSNPLSPHI